MRNQKEVGGEKEGFEDPKEIKRDVERGKRGIKCAQTHTPST